MIHLLTIYDIFLYKSEVALSILYNPTAVDHLVQHISQRYLFNVKHLKTKVHVYA